MKKKVIICGFGFMGQTHAANILKSEHLILAGVVNPTVKEKIKPIAGNINTAAFDWKLLDDVPFFTTLQDALESCDFDAAVISSPTLFHASEAEECLKHGKHVFLEKPLCATPEEAERLITAARTGNCVFHVGHCLRFFPEYSFLKTVCTDGRFGKLKHLKLLRRTGVPSWGAWKNKDTSLSSITGPVFDLNIHDVDFALHLLGKPTGIISVQAGYDDKTFDTLLKYPDNVNIEISGGFSSCSTYPFRAGYTAVFENAVLEFDTRSADTPVLSTNEKSETVALTPADGYQLEMDSFARALNGEDTPHCSITEAAEAVYCCLAIIDSL